MDCGYANTMPYKGLEITNHIPDARVTRQINALPIGMCQLGCNRAGQAESQGGDVTPTQKTSWNACFIHRTHLISDIAGVRGNHRSVQVYGFHQIAIHTVRIYGCVVALHQRFVFGRERLLGFPYFFLHILACCVTGADLFSKLIC